MHKKYFFFDIDGTLSTGLTTMMPESAVKALAQLRANGHFTAIACLEKQLKKESVRKTSFHEAMMYMAHIWKSINHKI